MKEEKYAKKTHTADSNMKSKILDRATDNARRRLVDHLCIDNLEAKVSLHGYLEHLKELRKQKEPKEKRGGANG